MKTKKLDMLYKYCTSFYKRHTSYYYSIQKTNYNSILKNNTFYNENQTFFDGKHTIKGDVNLVSIEEVKKLLEGDTSGRVNR